MQDLPPGGQWAPKANLRQSPPASQSPVVPPSSSRPQLGLARGPQSVLISGQAEGPMNEFMHLASSKQYEYLHLPI